MRLFYGLFAVVLVACGGSEGSSVSAGDGGPADGAGDLAADAGAGGGEGTGADAGADGSIAAEGGDTVDASVQDTRIDPIEVGRSWTYNVTVLGFYPVCSNGVFTSNALESSQLDGKTAIHVQSMCKNAGVYKYSVDGDRVHSYIATAWRTSLDSPVVDGHTWSDGFRDYRWDSKGSFTTPAGTFSDCWSATTVASYTSYILLCRGVGPVKWHYEDGLGNGYEAILTAKNF